MASTHILHVDEKLSPWQKIEVMLGHCLRPKGGFSAALGTSDIMTEATNQTMRDIMCH